MPSLQHLGWLQQWWAKTKWIAANPPNEPAFGYNGLPGPCSQCKPSSRSAPTLEGLWVAHLQCNWIFQPACVFALCSLKTKLSPWCLHAANGMELSTGQHIHQIVSNIACLPAYWRHPKKESQCSSSSASSHACMAYKGPGLVSRRCLPALPPHCKWCQLPAPTFWILLVSNSTFSLSFYPRKKKLLGILWAQAGWILCICSLHWHLLHLAHEKRHCGTGHKIYFQHHPLKTSSACGLLHPALWTARSFVYAFLHVQQGTQQVLEAADLNQLHPPYPTGKIMFKMILRICDIANTTYFSHTSLDPATALQKKSIRPVLTKQWPVLANKTCIGLYWRIRKYVNRIKYKYEKKYVLNN